MGSGVGPRGGAHRRDGGLPAGGGRGGPDVSAVGGERAARVPAALRRGARADRRSGPLPHTGDGHRAELRGRSRGASAPGQPGEHLPRAAHGPGTGPPLERGSDAVDAPGRAAAEQGADNRTPQAGRPSGQGLGRGHRAGHPGTGRAGHPLVSILWGRDARNLRPSLGDFPAIESAHPSPMSADRGFFGSRPFSKANELLVRQGAQPVDWRLP